MTLLEIISLSLFTRACFISFAVAFHQFLFVKFILLHKYYVLHNFFSNIICICFWSREDGASGKIQKLS